MRGAAISLKTPSSFESASMEAKAEHFESGEIAIIQEGINAADHAPGADRRANKRSSRFASLSPLAALRTTRSPRLALAGVIITALMIADCNFPDNGGAIRSFVVPKDGGDSMISDPEHVMDIIAKGWGL